VLAGAAALLSLPRVPRPSSAWAGVFIGHGTPHTPHLTGEPCPVEIESQWTARARERLGIYPTVRGAKKNPAQAELERGTL